LEIIENTSSDEFEYEPATDKWTCLRPFAQPDVLAAVVTAMRAHPTSTEVMHWGLYFLAGLAENLPESHPVLLDSGTLEVCVQALCMPPGDSYIYHNADLALNFLKILAANPDNRSRLESSGAMKAVRQSVSPPTAIEGTQQTS